MNNQRGTGVGMGFLAGVLVGTAIGILFAPRPGKETREQLKKKTAEFMEKAKGMAQHMESEGK